MIAARQRANVDKLPTPAGIFSSSRFGACKVNSTWCHLFVVGRYKQRKIIAFTRESGYFTRRECWYTVILCLFIVSQHEKTIVCKSRNTSFVIIKNIIREIILFFIIFIKCLYHISNLFLQNINKAFKCNILYNSINIDIIATGFYFIVSGYLYRRMSNH